MILYGIDNIRDLSGHKVEISLSLCLPLSLPLPPLQLKRSSSLNLLQGTRCIISCFTVMHAAADNDWDTFAKSQCSNQNDDTHGQDLHGSQLVVFLKLLGEFTEL